MYGFKKSGTKVDLCMFSNTTLITYNKILQLNFSNFKETVENLTTTLAMQITSKLDKLFIKNKQNLPK